jgi:RND family efflux transporter MFP subunit
MKNLRERWILLLVAGLLVAGPIAWYRWSLPIANGDATNVIGRAKQGDFRVTVTTTGELRARKFVQVQGPTNAQQAEVWQMKLSSIVPEGTVVKAGDVVAELDRSAIASKAAEVSLALQKAEAQYTQAQLDSALTLSQAREDIRNFEFTLEEKRIAKEQASYEAPSIRRQTEIDYEKAQRQFEQSKSNYKTKTQQSIAKMREVSTEVERQRNKQRVVSDVMQAFTIRAPAPGMVIYAREWNGKKKAVGSQVTPWDPTVATLPDLLQMESFTYVNEVDVRKLSAGQPVTLTLDADPGKKLSGRVVSVANVGEQRPNSDAKVFEVKITVDQADTTLRPGMTTANAIETAVVKNAVFVPLEAVSNEGNVPYVYKRDGSRVVRQQVETGLMNDNEIVVLRGIQKDDRLLLSVPADKSDIITMNLAGAKPVPPAPAAGDTPHTVQPTRASAASSGSPAKP